MGRDSADKRPIERAADNAAGEREVGRIVLEGRCFAIVPAPKRRAGPHELCRFDVAGHSLAVVEAAVPLEANEENLALRLTGRELEIAALVAQGHANKNIAYRLQISEWTVATYLRRIFLKLDVESRAAMVFRCAPFLKAKSQ